MGNGKSNAITKVEPGNIFDYIKWRGDISLEASAFNEIDNLILSQLPYVNFGDIISGDSAEKGITIEKASERFFKETDIVKYTKKLSSTKNAIYVLQEIAKADRFKNMKLFSYIKDISENDMSQFSVLSVDTGDGHVYVSFSGTDDTIVGWHEDFNMAYLEKTMGQVKAVQYVDNLNIPSDTKLYFGGHSKGGNLAISAALYCKGSTRERLEKIYNNDGPGFSRKVIESEEYKSIIPLIHSVMPSGSIVGVLFDHGDEYKYIGSTNIGLKEHDALSWQILGNSFYEKGALSKPIVKIDEQMSLWMDGMTLAERELFVETLFFILQKAGIKTVDDLVSEKLANVLMILVAQKDISQEDKNRISKLFKLLIKSDNIKK